MILIQQPLLDFNFLHAEAIFLMVIKKCLKNLSCTFLRTYQTFNLSVGYPGQVTNLLHKNIALATQQIFFKF